MNSRVYKFFIAIQAVIIFSCNNVSERAVSFNDSMMMRQDTIISLFDSVEKYLLKKEIMNISNLREMLLRRIESETERLKRKSYNEEFHMYKEELIELMQTYRDIASADFQRLISIYTTDEDSLVSDSVVAFNNLIDRINNRLQENTQKFSEFQKDFALKYKFELTENREKH